MVEKEHSRMREREGDNQGSGTQHASNTPSSDKHTQHTQDVYIQKSGRPASWRGADSLFEFFDAGYFFFWFARRNRETRWERGEKSRNDESKSFSSMSECEWSKSSCCSFFPWMGCVDRKGQVEREGRIQEERTHVSLSFDSRAKLLSFHSSWLLDCFFFPFPLHPILASYKEKEDERGIKLIKKPQQQQQQQQNEHHVTTSVVIALSILLMNWSHDMDRKETENQRQEKKRWEDGRRRRRRLDGMSPSQHDEADSLWVWNQWRESRDGTDESEDWRIPFLMVWFWRWEWEKINRRLWEKSWKYRSKPSAEWVKEAWRTRAIPPECAEDAVDETKTKASDTCLPSPCISFPPGLLFFSLIPPWWKQVKRERKRGKKVPKS